MSQERIDPRMTRHVKDAWPDVDQLLRAGESVQQLVEQFGWTLLMDIVDREIATIDADLDGATVPKSQAEYALAHGRRDGLRSARRAAEAILGRYEAALEEQRIKHEGDAES